MHTRTRENEIIRINAKAIEIIDTISTPVNDIPLDLNYISQNTERTLIKGFCCWKVHTLERKLQFHKKEVADNYRMVSLSKRFLHNLLLYSEYSKIQKRKRNFMHTTIQHVHHEIILTKAFNSIILFNQEQKEQIEQYNKYLVKRFKYRVLTAWRQFNQSKKKLREKKNIIIHSRLFYLKRNIFMKWLKNFHFLLQIHNFHMKSNYNKKIAFFFTLRKITRIKKNEKVWWDEKLASIIKDTLQTLGSNAFQRKKFRKIYNRVSFKQNTKIANLAFYVLKKNRKIAVNFRKLVFLLFSLNLYSLAT